MIPNEALQAALVALVTAGVLKLIDWLLSRGGERRAGRRDMVAEVEQLWRRADTLQKEIDGYRARIVDVEAELARSRLRIAELQEINAALVADLQGLRKRLGLEPPDREEGAQ